MKSKTELIKSIVSKCGGNSAVAAHIGKESGKEMESNVVRAWSYNGSIPSKHFNSLVDLGGKDVKNMLRELVDLN